MSVKRMSLSAQENMRAFLPTNIGQSLSQSNENDRGGEASKADAVSMGQRSPFAGFEATVIDEGPIRAAQIFDLQASGTSGGVQLGVTRGGRRMIDFDRCASAGVFSPQRRHPLKQWPKLPQRIGFEAHEETRQGTWSVGGELIGFEGGHDR
jgi:hypothetical protein